MPEVSLRGKNIPSSPIRKLVPLAEKAKAKGIKVYGLNIGQPDIETPKVSIDALRNIDRKILEYSPSDGYLSYRTKLVSFYKSYNINITAENIIITCGGSEAVLFSYLACLDPGDEMIITEPTYANYISFAMTAGVVIKTIPTSIDDGFKLPSIEKFEAIITEKTKAIMICNPNNPTGYIYTKEEMHQLQEIVKRHNLYLFSDEVYREFVYSDSPYISALDLKEIEENVVVIDSVSKRYSACGIRIGALITKNKDIRSTVMKFCQARLSPPLIGQIVAEASIEAGKEYLNPVHKEYLERRNFLLEKLNKIPGVYSPIPMGAFYTIARLPIDDADKFCAWCLSDFEYEGQTIFTAPASGFYHTPGLGKNEVRLAYVLKKEDLAKAMIVLEKALEAYNKEIMSK